MTNSPVLSGRRKLHINVLDNTEILALAQEGYALALLCFAEGAFQRYELQEGRKGRPSVLSTVLPGAMLVAGTIAVQNELLEVGALIGTFGSVLWVLTSLYRAFRVEKYEYDIFGPVVWPGFSAFCGVIGCFLFPEFFLTDAGQLRDTGLVEILYRSLS